MLQVILLLRVRLQDELPLFYLSWPVRTDKSTTKTSDLRKLQGVALGSVLLIGIVHLFVTYNLTEVGRHLRCWWALMYTNPLKESRVRFYIFIGDGWHFWWYSGDCCIYLAASQDMELIIPNFIVVSFWCSLWTSHTPCPAALLCPPRTWTLERASVTTLLLHCSYLWTFVLWNVAVPIRMTPL